MVARAWTDAGFRALMLEAAAWIETGPWTKGDASLRERPIKAVARQILEGRRRAVVKRGKRLAALAPAPRHKLRINARKRAEPSASSARS